MTRSAVRHDEIGGDFVPVPRGDVAGVELDGDGVLYDEATRAVHVLNATALAVWAAYDGVATLDELAARLAEAYGADVGTVRSGVLDATRELARLSLLEGVEGEVEPRPTARERPRYLDPPHS